MVSTLGTTVRWKVYVYGLPAMAWAVFLMVTALAPSLGPIEDIDIVSHQDKLVHFIDYLVLAFLTVFALLRGTKRERRYIAQVTFASVASYGVVLEVLQVLVPERDFSLLDMGANVAGAVVGTLAAVILLTAEPLERPRQV